MFLVLILFLLISCNDLNLTKENKKKLEEYEKSFYRLKLVSCLNLIQKAVVSNNNGNIDLIVAMRNTKLDKDKFYDKYILALTNNCIKKITKGQLEYLLIPENIENYDISNKTNENLIKLDYEIKTVEYTDEEKKISLELTKRLEENIAKREQLKNKNSKKNKAEENKDNKGINWNFIIKVLAAIVPIIIFTLFNQQDKNDKKVNDVNNKMKEEKIEKKENKEDLAENKEKENKKIKKKRE